VRKLSLTQEQLARVLRVPGITNGEEETPRARAAGRYRSTMNESCGN
jgi:hypothetical protein